MQGSGWGRGPYWVCEKQWEKEEAEQGRLWEAKRRCFLSSAEVHSDLGWYLEPQSAAVGRNRKTSSRHYCHWDTPEFRWEGEKENMLWMDLEIIILSEVSQKEKDKYHMISLIYVESKIGHKWTYLGNTNIFTDIENKLMVSKGERGWGRDKLGVWD